jgi:phosphoglycerate dehydrogenase-like enzyme
MKKILLSLAPVSVETLKSFIQRSPGVPEFDVIDGHDLGGEELASAFAKADVVLGTWTFKRIGKDLVAKAGSLNLIQQPSIGYDNIDLKACSERGILVANSQPEMSRPSPNTPSRWHWPWFGSWFAPTPECARADGTG